MTILSGERLRRYQRIAKTDLWITLSLFVLPLIFDTWFSDGWLMLISMLGFVMLIIYRFLKRETIWQLQIDEVKDGKKELEKMRKDMESVDSQ